MSACLTKLTLSMPPQANMAIVGTVPYPDERSIRLAARRGIIITNHHFNLLGLNTFRWPSSLSTDYDFQVDPSLMAYAWKSSIATQGTNQEVRGGGGNVCLCVCVCAFFVCIFLFFFSKRAHHKKKAV